MATTPLYRSMELLRKRGYSVEKTEHRNPHVFRTHDLFNFADAVAIRPDKGGVLAVQSTTVSHQAERLAKIVSIPEARVWLQAGNRIVVHGWAQGADGRWRCTERLVSLGECEDHTRHDAPTDQEQGREAERREEAPGGDAAIPDARAAADRS